MGVFWEIIGHPGAWFGGVGLAVILLTQDWAWRWRLIGVVIMLNLVILLSRFEIEAKHGVYDYEMIWVHRGEYVSRPKLINPGLIGPETAHLAAVQLVAAILIALICLGLVRLYRGPQGNEGPSPS